ncbi:hypothetical protein J7438_12445 [Thalassotalea sp. G20_0]|uniref:hypothetical protein n=1 Tax=Thalassotalea sp. G20_0 TaxID=2821093 RepID=UPI001ADACABE|nr:hypothetical protein [Thalassotalea sp. G20_0]MBO9494886.1 hypothetical protein [Thalassotalea sp. G20_0]
MENYHGATNISCDVLDSWFEVEHVDILSVGGGPGSDVCGVLEYLEKQAKRRNIELSVDVIRLDIEDQWDEVFNDIMERFFPWVNYRTVHMDVNDGFGLISGEKFNLVTASYLTSELSSYPNEIATVVGPKFSMNSGMFVGVKR